MLLSALRHIFAGFKRTRVLVDEWSIEFGFTDDCQKCGKREHVLFAFICAQSDTFPSVRSFVNLGSSLFAFGSPLFVPGA